ncbi:ergothioneine biosynthesis protein EgtB [Tenacibaculum maritimum]|uniref:ergothioneine biosynthesis protein EgtB n=1 Tax=Tenacibaculum maritimum TaxID=107401 RepID=UPI003875DCA0
MNKKESLLLRFKTTRKQTEVFCNPLKNEDYSVQPVVDVSPPKWHLAHTTWFFEQFILVKYLPNYKVYNTDFAYLFNSYYNNAGKRVLRPNRGLMTRPTVKEVYYYRAYITEQILMLFYNNAVFSSEISQLIEIGIHHEEQHQELLAYDIKYILGHQHTFPAFESSLHLPIENDALTYFNIKEGVYKIGHQKNSFSFDNELGAHKVYINPFSIANKLVTNREFIEFIADGGYQNFNLWHADGWDFIQKNAIKAPLYWHQVNNEWKYYNYNGLQSINLDLPVTHISYYEAFAFAEWKKMRLPTEFEWEVASDKFNWGNLWEWTGSAYLPYPSFKKTEDALGEYNGKFMVNQHVLRGASIATPKEHRRKTYRNFFPPNLRWMFSGIRLVK